MKSISETPEEALPATGAELRGRRDAAGIQQQVLAQALDLDTAALSKIENGIKPLPADLPARYMAEVRRIARERAEAVGAMQEAVTA